MDQLKVLSASPKGEESAQGRLPITVTFNQPVVALSEKNFFSGKDCPLQITPFVEGDCRFVGSQTLQFEPKESWSLATNYDVKLSAGLRSQVSGDILTQDYSFSFTTQYPRVEGVLPADNEQWIDRNPLIFVALSQEVDLSSVAQSLTLNYEIEKEPNWWEQIKSYLLNEANLRQKQVISASFSVRALTQEEHRDVFSWMKKENIFVIKPEKPLPEGTEITLEIKPSLRGKEGNMGMKDPFVSHFFTYPELEVTGKVSEGCLPYDAQIQFSSPVRLETFLQHVHVYPEDVLRELTEQEKQTLGRQYNTDVPGNGYFALPLSFVNMLPEQTVTISIDKDLTDVYGQKLGKEQTFVFTNTGYCPAVDFQGGEGVLESYFPPRHPIDVLNINEIELRAARFNKETFIPFLQKNIPYCGEAEIKQADLQYEGLYPFSTEKDKTHKTYLDLKNFNPTAQNSIIFSQIKIPSQYRKEGYCWINATDNITDLGLTVKSSQENTLVWVTSLREGKAQKGISVELKDDTNTILWKGKTDENGLAMAPGLSDLKAHSKNKWTQPSLYVFASSSGGDAVLCNHWNGGLEPWRFQINYQDNPQKNPSKLFLFTDRGIYRPEERIYIKGFSRNKKDGKWIFTPQKKGTLKIINPRGDSEFEQEVFYQENKGSFDVFFDLSKTAVAGIWQLYFVEQDGKNEAYATVRVEAVEQADFSVSVNSLKEQYISGETAKFSISADYLFGAPVSGGKVKWTVRRIPSSFSAKNFEGYEFIPYFLTDPSRENNTLLSQSSGELNEKGKIDFSLSLPQVSFPQRIYTQASVQDLSGQELFARQSVLLHSSSFYLGSKVSTPQIELGEDVQAHIVATSFEGAAVGGKKVTAKIQKEEYLSVRKNGLAGRLEWVSQRREKEIKKMSFNVEVSGYDFSFKPDEAGLYQVILESVDEKGRKVQGGFEFVVYGKGKAYWKQNDDDILVLKQDKSLYDPNDTARILVQSPYEEALALVTVEREGVLDAWTVPISAGADYISVPMKAHYVPNVFVGVTLVRGRSADPKEDKKGLDLAKPQGKAGYVNLNLSQKEKEIQTQVLPDKRDYKPGSEANIEIKTSLSGKPIEADITLMVVDEGVLALTDYQTPELLDVFYGKEPLSVLTADNRMFLIGQRNLGEKGENRGGGGAELSKWDGTDLRSNFEFTPYFNGKLRTDEKGSVFVKVKLPDNLTTFRVMAVAATETEFGSGQNEFTVSQPLIITPKLPRFIRQGDRFTCGAIVRNYSEGGPLTISAHTQGGILLTEKEHSLSLEKGKSAEVAWNCEATEIGEAKIFFHVQSGHLSDAVEKNISVLGIEKKQTLSLYGSTDKKEEQLLRKPSSLDKKAQGEVNLSLASTALLGLRGSLMYLLDYPYNCLEQNMSKILPLIQGSQWLKDFDVLPEGAHRQIVQENIDQIPQYQTSDGGYSYWPSSEPDPYLTAYTLEVAYWAKQAGYELPAASISKALIWLKKVFGENKKQAFDYSAMTNQTVRAYAVYVLALYGEQMIGQFNNLYTHRNALPLPALAYLLQSAPLLNQPKLVQDDLAQRLLNHAVYGAQTLHFTQENIPTWLPINDEKVTALCLQALLKTGDYLSQPYQVVRWLLTQVNAQGHWQNTHSNAAVFSALYAYYMSEETVKSDFEAVVSFDKKEVAKKHFKGYSLQSYTFQWPMEEFYDTEDETRVRLNKTGKGILYYSLAQNYVPKSYDEAVNAGFTVSRTLTDLQGNPMNQLKEGQRYKVVLKIESAMPRSFVVLEDFLPAGLEIVHTDLATQTQVVSEENLSEQSRYFSRNEKYKDRFVVFADSLPAGEYEYSYLVQARISGVFSYPSLWGSQMYDPAVFGRTKTEKIEIQKS